MAYTTINKSTDYFNTKLYTGNGTDNHAITGVGFQPDFVWFKDRDASNDHSLYDAVRGATKRLKSDQNAAESTQSDGLKSFDSDGFTLGTHGGSNGNNNDYASWNWKANGSGSANTDGSINTTSTSVNTTAGFSISKYTGNQTNGATVGHGLGAVPKMIIIKNLNDAEHWTVYHHKLPTGNQLYLNLTNGQNDDASEYYDTTPTSSVFTLGNSDRTNNVNIPYIAYCFAEKAGYSKFGSYIGNGNNDGTFVYTGFKPAWVMIKKTTGDGWQMFDNKRDPYNAAYHRIEADSNAGDYTGLSAGWIDMVSNGFKVRYNGGGVGSDGVSYIYMAFGQSLVGSNNIPCTAR